LFGLEASAKYGLSLRIIAIIQGMAFVWPMVKFPLIGQLRARGDFANVRKIFWPRLWLQILTFILLAAVAVPFSPFLLKWIGSDKEILPMLWLSLLALNSLLEAHYSIWGTLIFLENRMPYLWPVVIANAASIPLSLVLINTTQLGLAAFVVAPLVTGILYNYWRWPMEGAKSLRTNWFRFMFSKHQ
jgi:Na+-driven multidrug efflux pump